LLAYYAKFVYFPLWLVLLSHRPLSTGTFLTTVKTLMFACPIFRDFRESIKTAKCKGANIEFQVLEISTSLQTGSNISFCLHFNSSSTHSSI